MTLRPFWDEAFFNFTKRRNTVMDMKEKLQALADSARERIENSHNLEALNLSLIHI